MTITRDKAYLAEAILGMPYGELKKIGFDLAGMIEDKDARPKLETADDFAAILWDWAEAALGEESQ